MFSVAVLWCGSGGFRARLRRAPVTGLRESEVPLHDEEGVVDLGQHRCQPARPPGQLRRELIPGMIAVDRVLRRVDPLRVREQRMHLGGELALGPDLASVQRDPAK